VFDDIEAWRDREVENETFVAFKGSSASRTGDAIRADGGALECEFGLLVGPSFTSFCRGVSPHVSKFGSGGFRAEFADSMELKLEVRLWYGLDSALVDRCLGTPNEVGGSIDIAFGRLSGRMICEAPFR
jgi:hypothetical protein